MKKTLKGKMLAGLATACMLLICGAGQCQAPKAETSSFAVAKGDFSLGVNYPGLGARYFLSNDLSLEVKAQFDKDIFVGGLRCNYYFQRGTNFLLFSGLEADYVGFKGEVSSGAGVAGELFAGFEYFFCKQWSFQADIGPAFLALNDSGYNVSVSGLEYVVSFGINFYLGK